VTTSVKTRKRCFKCNQEQPVEEFYRHPQMGDGRLNKCRTCTKSDVSQNYRRNREHYASYEQQRFKLPERKRDVRRYAQKRAELRPERTRAAYLTSNAIRDGRLVRQPCEVCGSEAVEAHHDDYSKPLAVRWLCRKHHLEHHGKVAF
jgi:hypothetical protein